MKRIEQSLATRGIGGVRRFSGFSGDYSGPVMPRALGGDQTIAAASLDDAIRMIEHSERLKAR